MSNIRDQYVSAWEVVAATIETGGSESAAINLGGLRPFGISFPDGAVANLSFLVSYDNGVSFKPLYDKDGTEVIVSCTAGAYVYLDPIIFAAVRCLKVRTGTRASPTVQASSCTIDMVVRSV